MCGQVRITSFSEKTLFHQKIWRESSHPIPVGWEKDDRGCQYWHMLTDKADSPEKRLVLGKMELLQQDPSD